MGLNVYFSSFCSLPPLSLLQPAPASLLDDAFFEAAFRYAASGALGWVHATLPVHLWSAPGRLDDLAAELLERTVALLGVVKGGGGAVSLVAPHGAAALSTSRLQTFEEEWSLART